MRISVARELSRRFGVWPPRRIDIDWGDLAAGLAACVLPRRAPGFGEALAFLSVRSGFDALLGALALPPGSEVLLSALTIGDMVRIVEAHGLVAVPVDVEPGRMAPLPDRLERALTPASRIFVAAHLFGGRIDLGPIAEPARRRGLLVVEDCAQAFAGPDWTGHAGADVSMFSFGPIKTSTALGGALLFVRDRALRARLAERQAAWPAQGRAAFAARLLKYAALKAVSGRVAYGLLAAGCEAAGGDLGRLLARAVRGFGAGGLLGSIRRRPSAPLLSLLARRLARFDRARLDRRAALGRAFAERLPPAGARAFPHSHWVLPVESDDPEKLIAVLRQAGFDAARGESMVVVEPPPGRPELEPAAARRLRERLVYLPIYPEMPEAELRRMVEAPISGRAPA